MQDMPGAQTRKGALRALSSASLYRLSTFSLLGYKKLQGRDFGVGVKNVFVQRRRVKGKVDGHLTACIKFSEILRNSNATKGRPRQSK